MKKSQGYLLGKMDRLGYNLPSELEILTDTVINSSEIEGVSLNLDQVRSFVLPRLVADRRYVDKNRGDS